MMRKIIAAINTTLDAVCDHTAGVPDDEIHQHYTDLLNHSDAILYGRKTYQLMEYWRAVLKNSSEEKSKKDFAQAIDKIPKIVFSHTMGRVDWNRTTLEVRKLKDVVLELKHQSGGDILVGSRSLIIQLMRINLIDQYQFCVHPLIAGGGLPLFEDVHEKMIFKLMNTRVFKSGAIILYYEKMI